MTAYIFQTLCFQALFLGVYVLFLKRETFFNYNRVYLIVTPIISLVLPFVKIVALSSVVPADTVVAILPEIVLGGGSETAVVASEATTGFQFTWQVVYLLGLFASIGIFGAKLAQCLRLFKFRKNNSNIITIPNSQEAFTFLHFIFLGDGLDALSRKQILTHERVHVKQGHTWDLLIFEILRIVFWFNPFVYFYQRQVAIVHEYIADAKAAGKLSKQQYYQDLLNMTFGTRQLSFTNTFFNHSFIKNRILMLQKSKSKKRAQLKYLMIIPIVLSMMIYVACTPETTSFIEENQTFEEKVAALVKVYNDMDMITADDHLAFTKKLGDLISQENNGEPANPEVFMTAMKTIGAKYRALNPTTTKQEVQILDPNDIPYAVIDEVPMFAECKDLATRNDQKNCTSDIIKKFVNSNFEMAQFKAQGITGKNRIFVQFKIDKTGKIVDVKSRAPFPSLQEEAERVVKSIPQMIPGKQEGKPVNVLYSLPITFYISE